ncbi:phosphoesterase [Methanospirillum lacunae]|uniref:Phosphoesterase n=1 Tax=Methanospirillum lacunae TaxID=668570 RepID=A0A2V2N2L8_9EURY|nr:phosphoesterase [Methanospirillum lacunae]PWR71976.1 phosphoesterase [Methanospirillum lacunae]
MFFRKRKNGPDIASISADIALRTAHIVHLTHNDFDAVGADAVHRIRFRKEGVVTLWSSVGKFPMYLEIISQIAGNGDTLSISDLSYRRGVEQHLRKIKQKGWRIEWRDHHRWNEDEIGLIRKIVDHLHIDTGRCACGICAVDLAPEDVIAEEIALVVCDYDLWKQKDPRSAVLGLVLQRNKNRDHVRDMLMMGVFDDGQIRSEYQDIMREMQRVMDRTLRAASILGTKYRMAVSPMFGYPSETAAYLRKELKSDIEVLVSDSGKFSIRSVPPISHLIAREFGGGGHPHAAGGFFRFTLWDKILLKILKKNRHFEKISVVAELQK